MPNQPNVPVIRALLKGALALLGKKGCEKRQRVRVRFRGPNIVELNQSVKDFLMSDNPNSTVELGGPADTRHGYIIRGAIFTNNADHEFEPEPGTVAATLSAVDANNEPVDIDLGGSVQRYVGQGRTFFNPDDNIPPGTRLKIVLSADATGTRDDGTIYWTVGPDRIGFTNVAGMSAEELTDPFTE